MNKIIININRYEDIIEKYNNNVLSDELARYIFNRAMTISINRNPEIDIYAANSLTDEQENEIADMIHKHFGLEVQKSLIISKYKRNYQMLLFLIGVFLITLSNLSFILNLSTIHELLLIFGWVAVWELIYDGLFVDFQEKIKRKRYKKLANAKINYINKEV